ncbi:MAG TPA: hypothetical protein PK447_02845 [Ignavibacteria bacterium]|nr:hypothetical protein [Ignavibacteria bacterium]
MNIKLINIILLLFLLAAANECLPQKWVNNNITEYFSKILLDDMNSTKNDIWLLGMGYLYRIHDSTIKSYEIPAKINEGSLIDYERTNFNEKAEKKEESTETIGKTNYSLLSGNGSVLWMIQPVTNKYFTIIEGEDFKQFNCTCELLDITSEIINHQVDEYGKLWILYRLYNSKEYVLFSVDKSGKYDINKIEFSFPVNMIKCFFIYKGKLHFVISKYNKERGIYSDYDVLYPDDSKIVQINEYISDSGFNDIGYKIHIINNDRCILISSNGKILFPDNIGIMYNNDFKILSKGSCFWFTLVNKLIYFTNADGFFKYDIESGRLLEVIDYILPKGYYTSPTPYYYDMKNIFYFNNCIWGLKCSWDKEGKPLCNVKTNGIKIYKLK